MQSKPLNIKAARYINWIIILTILLAAFLFFMPQAIEYSDYALIRAIPTLLSLGIIPGLVLLVLILNAQTFKPYFLLIWFISASIVGMVSSNLRYDRRKEEFAANGVWGKAIVTEVKNRVTRGNVRKQVKCRYSNNHIIYNTGFVNDDTHADKIGDTIEIFYSKAIPRMYHLDVWNGMGGTIDYAKHKSGHAIFPRAKTCARLVNLGMIDCLNLDSWDSKITLM